MGDLEQKFCLTLHAGFIPRAVRFDTRNKDLYVFAWKGGKMYVYSFVLDSSKPITVFQSSGKRGRYN
jgi:hypothetical protein